MNNIYKRLSVLFSVKSIVTLVLTGVFAYLAISSRIDQDFMTIYAVIIAFYFGTQAERKAAGEPAEPFSGTLVSDESEPATKA